ncbi:FAD-binding protein [Rhodobacteraceae bacterium RKSG542]|uniref:FAD-binding protein n=1 Tax=Pseudovibrio flavus TaxID=2529854 RepID=UPI0012BB89FC|nr:FAD-binding protein [Pseudovibrio flavus]MTI15821.1 FAD-binding protein [Pseudovibrio flavus]
MSDCFKPETQDELAKVLSWAAAEETPMEIIGSGSKRQLGRPVQVAYTLSLENLSGIVDYEPAELVLTAKAGTPIAEIEALLSEHGQELAFEPVDYGGVLGTGYGKGTLAGVCATNLAGSRRLKAGAARDHVLGIHGVSGRGEIFKAGGRVVKNVTGYDIARAFCSSWGTLGVASELTLKVMPAAALEETVVVKGLSGAEASEAMSAAMGSSAEVSSAAFLPLQYDDRLSAELGAIDKTLTVLRLEGVEKSVNYRVETLRSLLKPFGSIDVLKNEGSRALWRSIRRLEAFEEGGEAPLWRISVAPTHSESVVQRLQQLGASKVLRDWAGGLLIAEFNGGDNPALEIRQAIAQAGGGHATLIRGSASDRGSIEVFQPQDPALALLTRSLKKQLDPKGILNPGRMYVGV